MFVYILLFCVGLVLLIKGGDWFVDGATAIAHRFRIPEIIIGATVVAIGTTLPEVMVSATGAVTGHGEIAYGNAIGSIICNTALVSAITMALRPGKIDKRSLKTPVIFFFVSAVFYTCVAYFAGEFARWVGIILLCVFIAYMVLTVLSVVKQKKSEKAAFLETTDARESNALAPIIIWLAVILLGGALVTFLSDEVTGIVLLCVAVIYAVIELINQKTSNKSSVIKEITFLVVGAVIIAIGADLLVDYGTLIAESIGVPETVIALTFVALGTSLPELVTAITSLAKGHGALSLGNVIGANLFNLVLVSGVAITLSPFSVPMSSTLFGINTSLVIDIPVMLGVMAIMVIPPLIKGKLSRWQGISLLCIYAAFCVLQFVI